MPKVLLPDHPVQKVGAFRQTGQHRILSAGSRMGQIQKDYSLWEVILGIHKLMQVGPVADVGGKHFSSFGNGTFDDNPVGISNVA